MTHYNHQTPNYVTNHEVIVSGIKAAISSDPLGKERITIIKKGICFMLSLNWIRSRVSNDPAFKKLCGDIDSNAILSDDQITYFKQIGNNFCTYADTIIPTMDKRVAIDLFGDSIPVTRGNVYDLFISACIQVKPILISTAAPTDAQGFEAYILSIPPSNSAIFHLLSLRSATAGHSVAIYQTGNDLYFFDCNSGEYQINSLRELFTELHSNYTGLTLASIFSYTF